MSAPVGQQAEIIAHHFHDAYEMLAPEHGYETRPDSACPWENVPDQNKRLMIAVAQQLLDAQVIDAGVATLDIEDHPFPGNAALVEKLVQRYREPT